MLVEAPSRKSSSLADALPDCVYDPNIDSRTRARLLEKEMNEQAKIVEDLKQLGANQTTVDTEERKLVELQAAVFADFRQEILNKLKKQGEKATALRDNLGLGMRPSMGTAHTRSKSTAAHPFRKRPNRNSHDRFSPSLGEEASPDLQGPKHHRAQSVDTALLVNSDVFSGTPSPSYDPFSSPSNTVVRCQTEPPEGTTITPSRPRQLYRSKRLSIPDILASTDSDSDNSADEEVSTLTGRQSAKFVQ